MSVLGFSHVAVCVADLERSLVFYGDGLGFDEVSRLDAEGEHIDRLLGVGGARLRAVFLRRDGVTLELLWFRDRAAAAPADARPMDQPGLTHVSLNVSDIDAVAERLSALGGRVLADSAVTVAKLGARAVFVLDPDGTRVELVETTAT